MKFPLRTTVAALAMFAASPALAQTVTYDGTDYNVTDDITILFGANNTVGLTSTLVLTFTGVDGNNYLFEYDLTNTASAPVTSSVVTGFGFDTDPENPSEDDSDVTGTFNFVNSGGFTGGNSVDICFVSNQDNNCTGAGNGFTGAVQGGADATGTLLLAFGSDLDNIILSDFFVRYQSINGEGSDIGQPTPPVPEPATWAMMLMGFGATGFVIRRRRKPTLAQVA